MAGPYDPLLRLDLRQDDEGGPPLPEVQALWRTDPALQRELLVLVHGFNNDRQEAVDAYAAFRHRQQAAAGTPALLDEHLGDLFWPGDARWPGLLDAIDGLVYPGILDTALAIAPRIARYLASRTDVQQVHFVAHSLGCRVVLETLRLLHGAGGPQVGKVCLMAAAVPAEAVMPGGGLAGALATPRRLRVLYSPDDAVLAYAFPIGQTMAGEGFFPMALGRHGDVPQSPGRVDRDHIEGAAHGDYWGQSGNAASRQAERALRDFLRLDALAKRGLGERPLPPRRPSGGQRVVGAEAP